MTVITHENDHVHPPRIAVFVRRVIHFVLPELTHSPGFDQGEARTLPATSPLVAPSGTKQTPRDDKIEVEFLG
jgi:hypothetical protein